jgi:hypothetical protein
VRRQRLVRQGPTKTTPRRHQCRRTVGGIAEPGGICVSDKVHQEMRGKIDVPSQDLGLRSLRNITEPVRVHQIDISGMTSANAVSRDTAQKPALALPDKPSIAVLSFTNLSGDPSQDYFSDGITDCPGYRNCSSSPVIRAFSTSTRANPRISERLDENLARWLPNTGGNTPRGR